MKALQEPVDKLAPQRSWWDIVLLPPLLVRVNLFQPTGKVHFQRLAYGGAVVDLPERVDSKRECHAEVRRTVQ